MVHAQDRVGTDGTVLFNGVDNGAYGADKHLTHISQAADCCRMERSKQNKHLVRNEDNDVDDGVDNGDNDSVDDGVDDGADGADKYLTYLSQVADCCRMERSEQNEHLVCNEDDDVDDGDDNSVDNGDDDGVDNGAKGADKHLTHLSQAADCCRTERSKGNKHLVCNEDDDVDDVDDVSVDNSDDDGVDDGVDDGTEGADKYLKHLSQAADCCRTERSKQNKHLTCDEDNDVDNGYNDSVDNGIDDGAEGADKYLTHLS
eukprot:5622675-Ditylum_brightwellii.AAC.1